MPSQILAQPAAPHKARIEYLDIIRGVCILFVAYFHSGVSMNFAQYVSSICVHPFFFLAGYFHSNKKSLSEQLNKKLRTMVLPYFVFGICYYALWLLASGGDGRPVTLPLSALIYMPTVDFPVEPALYFLPMMFSAGMMWAVIEKYLHNELVKIVLVFAVSWVGAKWTLLYEFRLPFSLDCAMAVLPYFYLGARGRKILAFTDGIVAKIPHKWQRVTLYLAVTAVNYYLVRINASPNVPNILNGAWCWVFLTHFNTCVIMLLWVYFFRFESRLAFLEPVNRALKFVGENSLIFMLFGHVGLKIGSTVAGMLPIGNIFIVKSVYYVLSIISLVPLALLLSKTRLRYIFGR